MINLSIQNFIPFPFLNVFLSRLRHIKEKGRLDPIQTLVSLSFEIKDFCFSLPGLSLTTLSCLDVKPLSPPLLRGVLAAHFFTVISTDRMQRSHFVFPLVMESKLISSPYD